MTAILKAATGIDSRWMECLQRHYPFHDPELGDHLLTVLAYVVSGAPQIWTETESKGSKGCKTSPIEHMHVVQKRFDRHQGELAAVLCVFKNWEKVPKRDRLRWCRRNHVNNNGLGQIQERLIRLKSDVQKMGRRRSLRSAEAVSEVMDGCVLKRLAGLLIKVFADCCYLRWHTGQTYLNMVTASSKRVDFSDLCLYEAFNVNLPSYILYLPNVTAKGIDDDFNPTTEVSISLVIPDVVAQTACNSVNLLVKNSTKVAQLMPVAVGLPKMGDAVVLRLAGNLTAQEKLKNDIFELCAKKDMLLELQVKEPRGAGDIWEMTIHCPEMYQKQIEGMMAEKVRFTMDKLETEVEVVPFPDFDSSLNLLVGGGAQVQEVQSNQHPVLVYIVRREIQTNRKQEKLKSYDDLTEDLIRAALENFGKIVEVQKSLSFPEETLWGSVRYEFLSSALEAAQDTVHMMLLNQFEMKVVHIESDCQVYKLNFHWRRSTLVRNKLQMYFLNEEDLNKFKKQKLHYDFKREYDDDELKAIITTDDTYSNLPDHTSMIGHLSVYPKFTTYNHHVIYEASEADIPKVKKQLKERMAESFTDPDLIDISFITPKSGACILTGTFNSYSVHRLMRLEDYIGYYEGSSLLAGGEMATDRRVHMNFTLPKEAFNKLEPELKKMHRNHGYNYSDSDDSGNADTPILYQTDTETKSKDKSSSYIKVEPEGELLNVTIYGDHYWSRIGQELKTIPKLMKPHVMPVRGDLLSVLLAMDPEKKQPNVLQIMNVTGTFIQIIKRNSLLHVYGPLEKVMLARDQIKHFLDVSASKTPQKPGSSRQGRGKKVASVPSKEHSECPVCLCDVQGTAFHLSLCGHIYCSECFFDLVSSCRSSRNFPVRCVKERCNRIVLNVDVVQICWDYNIPTMDVLKASMQAFQRRYITSVYPCITPDCEMVYRMCTSKMEGMVRSFTCPLCKVSLCTYCHCAYHTGLSCTVFKAMQTVDNKVKAWMDEDKDFRKLCPNCKTGIEKVDGCDHLHCTACKAEICWVCLQFFTDARRMSYHRCSGEDAASDAESDADMED